MRRYTVRAIRSLAVLACAVLLMGQAGKVMWMTSATFPVPTDDKPLTLAGLSYDGRGGIVEVTSARLQIESKEGDSKVHAVWTLIGRNATPQARKVSISVFLLNAAKKRIAVARKTAFIGAVQENHVFELKMKVKPKTWALAKNVYVQVDFLVR